MAQSQPTPSSPARTPNPASESEPTPTAPGQTHSGISDSGAFREVLLECFPTNALQTDLRQCGRFLQDLLHRADPLPPERELAARTQAILTDLLFLALFLQENVDTRGRSTLSPEDEELAHEALLTGARLQILREHYLPDPPPLDHPLPTRSTWNHFFALRETTLWPIAHTPEAQALRTFANTLEGYAREALPKEDPEVEDQRPGSPVARDLGAVARDLEQLGRFVEETAGLVGGRGERELGELAERVVRVGERWGSWLN